MNYEAPNSKLEKDVEKTLKVNGVTLREILIGNIFSLVPIWLVFLVWTGLTGGLSIELEFGERNSWAKNLEGNLIVVSMIFVLFGTILISIYSVLSYFLLKLGNYVFKFFNNK